MLAQINIDIAVWQDALAVLGPFLGVAAGLAVWQIYVVKKFDNKRARTWLLVASSALIMVACLVALAVGFINSLGG